MMRLVSAVLVLVALAFTSSAFAQESPDEAKKKGDDAMVALRYQEALTQYRTAYEATKNPALLYNMGRAYEGLADFPKALDALEEFSDKAPPDLKARVPKLDELLRDVRGRVATLVISSNVDDAEIRVGERVVGATKKGQVVFRLNAGKQKVVVSKEGFFPVEKDAALGGGRIETIDAALTTRASSGLLRITSPVAGATVFVNGTAIGSVPAESSVSPGEHKVGLQRDGYDDATRSVFIAPGESKILDVPMAQRASILSKWWFWTGVGLVAAGGVATVLALTTEKDADTGTIAPGQVKAELGF